MLPCQRSAADGWVDPLKPAKLTIGSVVVTIRYVDGSLATIQYAASGHRDLANERRVVFAAGRSAVMDGGVERGRCGPGGPVPLAGGRLDPKGRSSAAEDDSAAASGADRRAGEAQVAEALPRAVDALEPVPEVRWRPGDFPPPRVEGANIPLIPDAHPVAFKAPRCCHGLAAAHGRLATAWGSAPSGSGAPSRSPWSGHRR